MSACFTSVITESTVRLKEHYRPCIETLMYSMRRLSECMDTPWVIFYDTITDRLKKKLSLIWNGNVEFRKVNTDAYAQTRDKHNARYWSFEAFTLYDYDKVIFMDSDLLCRGSCKELLNNSDDIAMARENRRDCWNAGVIVLGKKYRTQEVYRDLLAHEAPAEMFGNDQKIYNSFFGKRIQTIDGKWNTLVTEFSGFDAVILLHYIHKCHVYQGRESLSKELISAWLDMYFECELVFGGDL